MATSTLGSGTLVLAGTTSGTTTVTATAVAGTTTLTLPAATDTLVGKATTDTLTNKTLTTPSVSSPTISDGTANGVAYLNGSKVLTTGSALTFNGSALAVTGTLSTTSTTTVAAASGGQFFKLEPNTGLTGIRRTWAFNPEFSASGQLSVMVGASEGAAPSIEVLKLTSTSLAVTGLTDISAATAGQIKFPATQNASSNANTLDDYEEGLWTPFIQNSSGTESLAFTDAGYYTKIGNVVLLQMQIYNGAMSVINAANHIFIRNIPFSASYTAACAVFNTYPAAPVHIVDGSGTSMPLYLSSNAVDFTPFTRNSWGGSANITLRGQWMIYV